MVVFVGCGDDAQPSFDAGETPDGAAPDISVNLDGDGDGVNDDVDPFPDDASRCGDTDMDTCDDCVSGAFNPAADGDDADSDGLCDLCSAEICGGNGMCAPGMGGVVCRCDEDHVGDDCANCAEGLQDRDGDGTCTPVCSEATCSGNGTCDDTTGTATCTCDIGFDGLDCTEASCEGITCAGEGTGSCAIADGVASCTCEEGFQDNDGNFGCDAACVGDGSSCSNHGDCDDSTGALACTCDLGYAGVDCSVTDCADVDCAGFGTCVDTEPTTMCMCDAAYQDNDGDLSCALACTDSTCSGNGTCDDATGTAACECALGWGGADCSVVDCTGVMCGNGMCDGSGAAAVCNCDMGYEDLDGDLVCTDIDECAIDNGGCGAPMAHTCVNNVGAAPSCGCAVGFQDNDMNGVCTPDCGGIMCGANSVCDDASGAATCACSGDFADCDGALGCETDTQTSVEHCGGCDIACTVAQQCDAGACVAGPQACNRSTDPGSGALYVVCAADENTAWVSADNFGQYHPELICAELGYARVTRWGGTFGSVCGTDEPAASCESPGTPTMASTWTGTGNCAADALGQVICNTVQWECAN